MNFDKEKYSTLFIDFDNTIVDYSISEKGGLHYLGNKIGMNINQISKMIDLYKIKNNELWKKFELNQITIPKIKFERFSYLKSLYNELDPYSALDLNDMYLKYFVRSTVLKDIYRSYLSKLKKKYNIIIVSNGIYEIQKARMFNIGLFDYIHDYITSEEAGSSKPNVNIFEMAKKKIEGLIDKKLEKKEILMIGDSYSADVIGSVNFKIDCCWISSSNNKKKANYIVDDFEKIAMELL